MTSLILPNTIANGANADGDKLNQDLQAIVSWSNAEVINRDGSVAMTAPLLLPADPTQPNQAATKAYVDSQPATPTAPVGGMERWHTGKPAPASPAGVWLLCDGTAISRTTYPDLFTVIGTLYGAGNGSTTFTLPPVSTPPYIIKAL